MSAQQAAQLTQGHQPEQHGCSLSPRQLDELIGFSKSYIDRSRYVSIQFKSSAASICEHAEVSRPPAEWAHRAGPQASVYSACSANQGWQPWSCGPRMPVH